MAEALIRKERMIDINRMVEINEWAGMPGNKELVNPAGFDDDPENPSVQPPGSQFVGSQALHH